MLEPTPSQLCHIVVRTTTGHCEVLLVGLQLEIEQNLAGFEHVLRRSEVKRGVPTLVGHFLELYHPLCGLKVLVKTLNVHRFDQLIHFLPLRGRIVIRL